MTIGITEVESTSTNHKMYDVFVDEIIIHTTVTSNHTAVTDWIEDIKSFNHLPDLVVGLEVRWRPAATSRPNPVAVLQLCVGDLCLIYQIIHAVSIPDSLIQFISGGSNPITFVGVGIEHALQLLQIDYEFGGGARHVDVRVLAAETLTRFRLRNAGLKELARVVLEREVEWPPAERMSGWDSEHLSEEQVQYACVDAFLFYELGEVLGAQQLK